MNKIDIITAGAIIVILLGLLFYSTNAKASDVTCGLFASIDFFLTDSQVEARIRKNIIARMGDHSIGRCVASRGPGIMMRGARKFCRKKDKGKTPKGLTLDGYFWSAGEVFKTMCLDDAPALVNWGNYEER